MITPISKYVLDKERMIGAYRPAGTHVVRFPATKKQHLYIMRAWGDLYKVGIAKDPIARRINLQCGSPFEIELVDAGVLHPEGVDALALEKEVHRILSDYRVSGEWFQTSRLKVCDAIVEAYIKLHCPPMYERLQRLRKHWSKSAEERAFAKFQELKARFEGKKGE